MNEEDKAWYHCGRCGSLFRSAPGDPDERVCAHCGRDPSLSSESQIARSEPKPTAPQAAFIPESHGRTDDGERSKRPKQNQVVAKLIIGWLFAMVLIVVAFRLFAPEDKKAGMTNPLIQPTGKGSRGDEDSINLEKAMASCKNTLGRFLDASTPEERNQFVLNPIQTAGRMARFYALNSPTRIDPTVLQNKANTILKLPTSQAVESRWETPEGVLLDCVFMKENDEWRLDWEHYIRYQEYPWGPFLAGEGPEECEFRLLVRRRLTRDGSESGYYNLVFYPPRFGRPESITAPSVEVVIQRDTENGKLLAAGFKQRESREPLFGSTLPDLDPEGFLRVRVKLRRVAASANATADKEFQLVQVLACHWLTTDKPGAKPDKAAPPP